MSLAPLPHSDNRIDTRRRAPTTLEAVIRHIESTTDDQWQIDVVRSKDGQRNCFFGHLFNMGRNEKHANEIWDWFENCWSTTYVIYPVNDGENPNYQQSTPRERVLAFLHALQVGDEPATQTAMAEDSERATYQELRQARDERDALAAKLARVEALLTAPNGHPHGCSYTIAAHTIRAALNERDEP